jgi:hypothetical protein
LAEGVYAYTDTNLHPTFPRDNPDFMKMYWSVVDDGEWEGRAGQTPATARGSSRR